MASIAASIATSLPIQVTAVYGVDSNVPVTNYQDPEEVWGTVVGVSKEQMPNLPGLAPEQFGRWRLGQRK